MQKIKGAKVSVADSRPFATPSRFLSRQNYRALLRNVCDSLRLFGIRLRRMIYGIIVIRNYMFYKMADPHPVRQEDANPTRAHPLCQAAAVTFFNSS